MTPSLTSRNQEFLGMFLHVRFVASCNEWYWLDYPNLAYNTANERM